MLLFFSFRHPYDSDVETFVVVPEVPLLIVLNFSFFFLLLVEFGHKLDEKMKAMLRETKENVQGTKSDGKEIRTQLNGLEQKEEVNSQLEQNEETRIQNNEEEEPPGQL